MFCDICVTRTYMPESSLDLTSRSITFRCKPIFSSVDCAFSQLVFVSWLVLAFAPVFPSRFVTFAFYTFFCVPVFHLTSHILQIKQIRFVLHTIRSCA